MRTPTTAFAASWRQAAHRLAGCALLAMATWPALAAAVTASAPVPVPAPIPATQVYRCAGHDGRTLYSQHACEGTADTTLMRVKDARTVSQTRHGKEIQERADKLAHEMQRVRQRAERKPAGRHAMTLGGDNKVRDINAKTHRASKETSDVTGEKKKPSRKTASADPRAPKPLRPAGFTARIPGSKATKATTKSPPT
jgi:hypothetical protein